MKSQFTERQLFRHLSATVSGSCFSCDFLSVYLENWRNNPWMYCYSDYAVSIFQIQYASFFLATCRWEGAITDTEKCISWLAADAAVFYKTYIICVECILVHFWQIYTQRKVSHINEVSNVHVLVQVEKYALFDLSINNAYVLRKSLLCKMFNVYRSLSYLYSTIPMCRSKCVFVTEGFIVVWITLVFVTYFLFFWWWQIIKCTVPDFWRPVRWKRWRSAHRKPVCQKK